MFFTAIFVPVSIILGILLAIALNQKIRFIWFYRTAIFIPFVASAAATGILANFVFNPQFGVANTVAARRSGSRSRSSSRIRPRRCSSSA